LTNASVTVPLPTPHAEAVARAQVQGIDWRTVPAADGSSVRLLTYALPGEAGAPVLQLGRPLADQERVLGRLLAGLLGLGLVSALLLGAGGWWVSGRSLAPAEAAWRQQQAFVSNASHELRTPLTLIRASAEVLARDLPPAGEPRALIDDIVTETDHMGQLVSDLLLLSRLDSRQVQLAREPVPLAALAADLDRQFGRLADARQVTFRSEASAGAALADPVRLRQVLLALLDVEAQHGHIHLASPVGEGTQVTVLLPGA
jgi:signal transduction histidine kinase